MKKNGYLVISLDFELLWGIFDQVDYRGKEKYFKNTREIIPKILQLFSEYQVHCTWATVGMLFNTDWEDWEDNIPANLPLYKNKELSAYDFADKIKNPETESYCFAPQLIKQIHKTPFQEIGTHTYSHYYCSEEGQNLEQFRVDLVQAKKIAESMGIQLESLVFPRNQFNKNYLKVCAELGIKSVRTNPDSRYWKNPTSESFFTKLGRTGDAYIPFGKRKSYSISELKSNVGLPLEQKASRFLRPYETNKGLHKLKMGRIKSEMIHAAKKHEIYHLWWHPHNFGDQPERSLSDLKEILGYYKTCKENYHFQSATMAEINSLIESNK